MDYERASGREDSKITSWWMIENFLNFVTYVTELFISCKFSDGKVKMFGTNNLNVRADWGKQNRYV